MFASIESRDLPYRAGQAVTLHAVQLDGKPANLVTRTLKQHNIPNRALVHFRLMHGHKRGAEIQHAARAWASSLMTISLAGSYSIREARHARRVLTLLALLAEVS
jgi:hypothetical protein